MGNRSYNSPLNKAPLRTVTGRGNDPRFRVRGLCRLHGFPQPYHLTILIAAFKVEGFVMRKATITDSEARFPSVPIIIRVPFFLVLSFNKEDPNVNKRRKGATEEPSRKQFCKVP